MARAFTEVVPRSIRISKADLIRWGYTAGCLRCASAMRGQRIEGFHSAAYRTRLEEEMTAANDPRPQRKAEREEGCHARALAAQDAAEAAQQQQAAGEEEEPEADTDMDEPDIEDMASMVGALLQLGLAKYEVHEVAARSTHRRVLPTQP
jgi:hypothetical protein